MKKLLFLLCLVWGSAAALFAQAGTQQLAQAGTQQLAQAETQQPAPEQENLLKKLDRFLESRELSGVDTNYIGAPKRKWAVFVNTYAADVSLKLQSNGIVLDNEHLDVGKIKINLHSKLENQISLGLYYRGYGLSYSWDVNKNYNKDLSFSLYSSPVGGEFRFHSTKAVRGKLDLYPSNGDEKLELRFPKGLTKVESFILNAYYVFNPKKFSYNAAMSYSKYQKKSAGSLIAGLTLFQNRVSFYDKDDIDMKVLTLLISGVDHITVRQGALGLGYAYNWVPAQGWNFHASALPMVLVTTKSATKATGTWSEDQKVVQRKLFGGNTHISYTYMLRGSVSYNLNDRFMVGVSGFYNHFRVGKKSKYFTSTEDWIARLFVAVRF